MAANMLLFIVVAGLDPAIHVGMLVHYWKYWFCGHRVDARNKSGHDAGGDILIFPETPGQAIAARWLLL